MIVLLSAYILHFWRWRRRQPGDIIILNNTDQNSKQQYLIFSIQFRHKKPAIHPLAAAI